MAGVIGKLNVDPEETNNQENQEENTVDFIPIEKAFSFRTE